MRKGFGWDDEPTRTLLFKIGLSEGSFRYKMVGILAGGMVLMKWLGLTPLNKSIIF